MHCSLRSTAAVRPSVRASPCSIATRGQFAPEEPIVARSRIRHATPTDVTQILEVERSCFEANLRSSQQSLQVLRGPYSLRPSHFAFGTYTSAFVARGRRVGLIVFARHMSASTKP